MVVDGLVNLIYGIISRQGQTEMLYKHCVKYCESISRLMLAEIEYYNCDWLHVLKRCHQNFGEFRIIMDKR